MTIARLLYISLLYTSTAALLHNTFPITTPSQQRQQNRYQQPQLCPNRKKITPSFFRLNAHNDKGEGTDLELSKRRLEALLSKGNENKRTLSSWEERLLNQVESTNTETLLSYILSQPSTTESIISATAAREQTLNEISLLSSLSESDERVGDFWGLWFSELGPAPASALLSAEELATSGPPNWRQAESSLHKIIYKYGLTWAEPINRLATLLYQQGRFAESKALCEIVIHIKPWHFGAISGICSVCAGLGENLTMQIWRDRRLPPFELKEERDVWVERSVEEAYRNLAMKENASDEEEYEGGVVIDSNIVWNVDEEEQGTMWQ